MLPIIFRPTTAIPSSRLDDNLLQCVMESGHLQRDVVTLRPTVGEEARQAAGGGRGAGSAPRAARAGHRRHRRAPALVAAKRLCNTTHTYTPAHRTVIAAFAKQCYSDVTSTICIHVVFCRRCDDAV